MLLLSHFSYVQLFGTPWTVAPRLLWPWNSLGKNTGIGCHALLQEIFPTQVSNPRFLHWGWILLLLSHWGSLRGEFRIKHSKKTQTQSWCLPPSRHTRITLNPTPNVYLLPPLLCNPNYTNPIILWSLF